MPVTKMPCTKPLVFQMDTKKPQLWGSLENLSKQGLQTDIMEGIKKGKFALLPCGKCEYCRKQIADQWATRIELEAKEWDDVIFLTLTYDNEHVPYGEIIKGYRSIQSQTVSKRDVQLFLKKLRKAYKKPIKYFLAAEYGDRTKRPHYHAIVFGLKPPDAQWYKNQKGNSYFKSEWLQKIWGKGMIDFSPAQPGSFAYVAQYVNKKAIGAEQAAKYWMEGREPEFRIMSKGIGEKYLNEHKDEILKTDSIICAGGREKRPPRYFDKILDKDTGQDKESYFKAHSDELREVRARRRRSAIQSLVNLEQSTNVDYETYLKIQKEKDKLKQKWREPKE